MAMVREQDLFFAIGPALDFALALVDGRHRHGGRTDPDRPVSSIAGRLLAAGAGGAAFLIGYLPQLLAYKALNGHYGPASDVQRKMTWYSPHGLEVLFSPEHGFFVWTPLAVLALAGFALLARSPQVDRRRIALCSLLMVGAQAYISGAVESWTVAGAFGQRRFVCLTILLTIGLAALLSTPSRIARRIAGGVVAICVWWNIALVAEFGIGLMNRQKLEPGQNAYDAFVTLPRMAPDLAWRYLFDRGSFYRPPAPGRQ
jgi:hypothetical protein